MRDLDLVGLSDDGTHVLLGDDCGEEYRVELDGRLRAAIRGDRVRLGQVEISMDNGLRPRDIQARIRAGESPEAVAAVAQVSLERIMGYAVPVLAEREHVCQQARRSALRRKHASGPGRLLGHAVDEHLRGNGWDPEAAAWDSWRREDGRWSVTVAPSRNGEPATFLFDAPGRYAVANDDAARRLVGDEPPLSVEPEPDEPRAVLSSVPAAERPAPLELRRELTPDVAALDAEVAQAAAGQNGQTEGDDAIEETPEPAAPTTRSRVSALDRLRRQRTQTGDPLPFDSEPAEPTGPAEPAEPAEPTGPTGPTGPSTPTEPSARTPAEPNGDGGGVEDDRTEAGAATDADVEAIARVMTGPAAPDRRPLAVGESGSGGGAPRDVPRKRKGGRRAVPSWDEIMFGSKPQP